MSTDINIKKRITILEESAILTKDVNSIDFVGTGVVSSAIGDDVTVTINGGVGAITYYLNQSVTQSPYKEFSSIVTTTVEQLVPLTVAGGVTSTIAEYQTPVGVPGSTQIAAGLWQFFLHFNAAVAGQNWIIRPTVWKRNLGGFETLLFTSDPVIVTNMNTTTEMYLSDGVFPATTLITTDRLVVKIRIENTTGVSQTVTFRTEGSQHYSVATTTLNPTYNPSAVLSVTGTTPVVSSGGTTPAISIPQADTLIDGYLSSSDFAVFNAKVGGSGTTNYLSKFTGTGTIGNSQTQDDGANIAVNGAILSSYKFAVYSTTPGENYNIYGNTTVNGAVGVGGVNTAVGASTNYGTAGEAQNSTSLNIGVYGQAIGASTENVGGKFSATLATSNYSVQLQDGTEGVGKVLTSMTADGKAQWAAPTSASGVLGISNSSGVYTYYTTLTLAMAAATSGKTITFFTDITETSNVEIILKDGVDINFNGYTYTLNTSGTANCFLANIANGRTRFYNGKIQRLGGTVSTANSCIILINNVASAVYNLDFNGVEIYSSFGVGTSQVNNTVSKINGVKLRTFSVGCSGGQISNSYIETFGGGNGCSISAITNCYVITTGGGHAIVFPYSGRASNCYASVSGAGSGNAIFCQSGVTVTNCTAISTRNSAVYNFGATSVFTYAYSTAGAGFEAGSSTRGSVTNCFAYATAGNAYLYNDEVTNCYGESTSTNAVNCFPAGNVYNSTMRASASIVGSAINRCIGSTFISTYNNANGHALNPYASALITNNTLIVANVGATCIYSAGVISVKYANNSFIGATTGVHANVSQLVTNTTDSQGNILM